MRRSFAAFLSALALPLAAACGTGGTLEPSQVSALRVYNASPDSPTADFFLRGGQIAQGLAFGFGQLHVAVNPGSGVIEVRNTQTADVLLDYSANLNAGTPYTFVLAGMSGSLQPLFFADDTAAAPTGSFKVRTAHLAPLGPAVDLYITDANADLNAATPAVTALAYANLSAYVAAPIGTQQLRITETGTKTVLRNVGTFSFTSGQSVTLFLIGASGAGGGGAPYSSQLVADHS